MKRLALAMLLVVLAAAPAGASSWHFETIDGHQNGPDGQTTLATGNDNSVVVYLGQPHEFSWVAGAADLRHGWFDGARWRFESLDGSGGPDGRIVANVGTGSAPALVDGLPHVWYADITNDALRHAWWDGARWRFETLDTAGGAPISQVAPSVTIVAGRPHVFYHDGVLGDLRHAWFTGAGWRFETLDGHQNGPDGQLNADVGDTSAGAVFGAGPHVWYHAATGGNLRHGWWDGARWRLETLDGHQNGPDGRAIGAIGRHPSTVLFGGAPQVFYSDETFFDLRHAWWDGATWRFEILDGAGGADGRVLGNVGAGASGAALFGGVPHVSYLYFVGGNEQLRHAWWDGARWRFETLDGAGGGGGRLLGSMGSESAATTLGAALHYWYQDRGHADLRHAWYG